MSKFITGNVVKLKNGSIVIVTENSKTFKGEDCVNWVSFDSSNCSGITNVEPFMRGEACFCCEGNEGECDTECEDCKGTGSYIKKHDGMEGAIILGSNVKEYIIKSLTKNFNF
jgi:hypothetical protein